MSVVVEGGTVVYTVQEASDRLGWSRFFVYHELEITHIGGEPYVTEETLRAAEVKAS